MYGVGGTFLFPIYYFQGAALIKKRQRKEGDGELRQASKKDLRYA